MKRTLLTSLILVGSLVAPIAAQSPTATKLPDGMVPVITVDGSVSEQNNPLDFFAPATQTLRDLTDAVQKATADPNVDALLVRLESPGWSLAQAGEFRDALMEFRATGKPLVVSADMLNLSSYYVASAGTRIALPEVGGLDLYGMSLSLYYVRDLLAKIGVVADGINTGKFKDAMDPFLRQEMSEGTREQYSLVMNDLFEEVIDAVAAGRGIGKDKAEEILTKGPYSTGDALEIGAIDEATGLDDLMDLVEEDLGKTVTYDWEYVGGKSKTAEAPSLMSLLMGSVGKSAKAGAGKDQIALVYALGPIVDGRADNSNPFTKTRSIASEDFLDLLDEAVEDGNTKALVLRVDSPGGSAIASDRIWTRLARLREKGIPIVVSMGSVAASGGYYISMGADKIFAEPTTLTGSIGVVGGKFTLGGTYEKVGIARQRLSRGAHSDIYGETDVWSAKEKEVLGVLLDDIYDTFTAKAATGRGKTQDEIKALGGGRVWSGKSALANGLVDELGGLSDAIATARELAKAPEAALVEYPKELSLIETIEKLMSGQISMSVSQSTALSGNPLFQTASLLLPPRQLAHLAFMVTAMRDRPTAMLVMPAIPEFD